MTVGELGIAILAWNGALAGDALSWMLTDSGSTVAGVYESVPELEAALSVGGVRTQAVIVDAYDSGTPAGLSRLRCAHPELKIVLLCRSASPGLVRWAIDEHAEGVVLKSDAAEEMVVALRHVLDGRAVMPVGWQSASLDLDRDVAGALSAREREVLALAGAGLSNKEIATRLVISVNTVKFHFRRIYAKLGVNNRVRATQVLDGTRSA